MVLNSKALHVTGALLVSTMLLQPSSFAQGLVEDSTANLTLRNFFFERTFTAPNYPQDKAREWTQSFIFDLRSGFTSGTIGVGVDVLGKYAVKLDGGAGRYGALLLPKDRDGEPADNFGRLGVALKARLGATELKVGEWMPNLPIVTADDFRALPQTFEGAQLSSQDIKHWTLYAGQLNKSSLRNDSSMEDLAFGSATVTLSTIWEGIIALSPRTPRFAFGQDNSKTSINSNTLDLTNAGSYRHRPH